MEKKCVKCQKLKSIDEFNKHNIIEYDNLFMCETCKKEDDEFFEWSMDFFKKQMIEKKQSKEAKDIIAKKKKKASIRGAKYCKNRKEIDPLFKLSLNIRSNIGRSLRRNSYSKKTKTYNILKCEYDFFMEWINGIASNGHQYGIEDLHLDHVVPVSLAQTEEEAILLNHYSNFQLLTSEDNISKGNRYVNPTNLKRVLEHHPEPNKIKEIYSRL